MERALIKIRGIVQGVGFRPFIHRQVSEIGLAGYIKNTSSGVELELEGEKELLERFLCELPLKAPKLAYIENIETEYTSELMGYEGFEIRLSKTEASRNTLISPDICICDDCLQELFTPADRRYRFPFINCTNCGPRFTIIKDIPYDRAKTSMGSFPMCPDCEREYKDITNRRYHAQPDCCSVCGPRLLFLDAAGRELPGDPVEHAREALKAGKIIAVKGLGGMHLACRCDDPTLVKELRRRKQRDEKPFALMCRNTECAEKLCHISEEEKKLLESSTRPIVLLEKREELKDSFLSENGYLGIMLPYTPVHYLLFGEDLDALIMTSANLSDTPIMFDNNEALENLRGIADGFLLNNRDIVTRCDDSLCWCYEGKEYFARRSRGYVPFPIKMNRELPAGLALGAEQKASFCLSKDDYVFPCQHIGDLKNMETFRHYAQQIEHFERMFDISPEFLACDLHPDYMSSEYGASLAEKKNIPLIKIQHHHAHMAACMADNGLEGDVIGLVWDGTGLGTDGNIWGGECLAGGYKSFERLGSIRPIPLIGGDRATKDLDRVAYAMLNRQDNPMYEMMLGQGINCPLSSGMGRLFDGAAAILGIRHKASYEGQGAVLLEAAADRNETGLYEIAMDGNVFDWRPMALAMAEEKDISKAAAKFMNTLIKAAVMQCQFAKKETDLDRVVLSGGSFQNMYIMKRLPEALRAENFRVYTHHRVSCNDEGISLGQLMAAGAGRE